MKPMTIIGVLLVVLGLVALAYQGITYTKHKTVIDIGPLHATADVIGTSFVRLRGRGFLEGSNSRYEFDGGVVTDPSASTGPDVQGVFVHDNDAVNVPLPVAGAGTLTRPCSISM